MLHNWGMIDSDLGVLSDQEAESHGHLFFSCPFSSQVLQHFC